MKTLFNIFKNLLLIRLIIKLIKNPIILVVLVLATLLVKDQVVEWYDEYMILYTEANNKIEEEENSQGLVLTKIDESLYTLIGTV